MVSFASSLFREVRTTSPGPLFSAFPLFCGTPRISDSDNSSFDRHLLVKLLMCGLTNTVMRRLSREELLAAEVGGPAHSGSTLVPAPAKVQAVAAQATKVMPTVRKVAPIVAKAQPLIRREATNRQALHAKPGWEVRQPRRLDRRLGCGRPAAKRTSSRTSSRGDPDLGDEPDGPRRAVA